MQLSSLLPALSWARTYNGKLLTQDVLAAVIVTIMLIPQSLAYAILAGLPPEMGLYASILPLVLYALFGSSSSLAVGPVAVVSLMTAVAISRVSENADISSIEAAIALAALSGLMLLAMAVLRLGFLANFLSHPVISGFITASGILIALSQLKHILGIEAGGHNLLQLGQSLLQHAPDLNAPTLAIGALSFMLLLGARRGLNPLLHKIGMPADRAAIWSRTGPVWAVLVTTLIVWGLNLDQRGVTTLGTVPAGLPDLVLPVVNTELWKQLAISALLISVVGFVESVSVAQTLGAKRRQRIEPDRELLGLGAANVGSAVSGGFPVTGGFSRSVVNFDAGAQTPAAGLFTAFGIGLATLALTPLLAKLPIATLAATIIVAVSTLIDVKTPFKILRYSRGDFAAMMATIVLTLAVGVEAGIVAGVSLSILLYLYRTSRPHTAVVGQIAGTEHFRNRLRHQVLLSDRVLSLRIDASLYFANARFLETCVFRHVAECHKLNDVILVCPAVNSIDSSALESLEAINQRLASAGVTLHLSEVKGPVMDALERTDFLNKLTGKVFLTQYQAVIALAPEDFDRLDH